MMLTKKTITTTTVRFIVTAAKCFVAHAVVAGWHFTVIVLVGMIRKTVATAEGLTLEKR